MMILLFHTTYNSYYQIFPTEVGKGGLNEVIIIGYLTSGYDYIY